MEYWLEQDVYEAGRRSLSAKKHTPSKKLLKYLTNFQQDELSTGTPESFESFAVQREKLVDVMRKNFPAHQYRQTISGGGIDVHIPKFWELIFTLYYITHEIEITNNIGFDKREVESGIHTARKIPHAEFKIVGDALRQAVAPRIEQSHSKHLIAIPDAKKTYVTEEAIKYQLTYNPSARELWLNDVLLANPQYGSENHKFLQYFVTEKNTGEQEVKDLLAFMNKPKLIKRPTQILTDVRITGDVKKVFFPNASKQSIEFHNPISIVYAKENKLPEIDLNLLSETVRSSQK